MAKPIVALHGHSFHDSVWLTNTFNQNETNTSLCHYKQSGGCGNLTRLLFSNFYNRISTLDDSSATPHALIVLERDGGKTSVVQWQDIPFDGFCHKKADWHHIAYLDSILNLEPKHLDALDGIVSADICGRQDIDSIRHLLPHIDYLFMSGDAIPPCDTLHNFLPTIGHLVRKHVICHLAFGSFFTNGDVCVEVSAAVFHPDINPLGAGDYFAAAFIANRLDGGNSVGEDIVIAHEKAASYLRRYQSWPK